MSKKNGVLNDMAEQQKYFTPEAEHIPDPKVFEQEVLPGFKRTLLTRRSIRIYDKQPIPEEVMKSCLKDATLAPSSSNLQPYELYWIKDPDKKEQAMRACLSQPAATTAGELIAVVARPDKWEENLDKLVGIMTSEGKKKLAPPVEHYYKTLIPKVMKNDLFGIANAVRRVSFFALGLKKPIVRTPVSDADHRISAHVQASLAAQTLMLSFSAHGYDTCPMGGMDALRISKILGLPHKAEVTMMISAGRRKPEGLYGPRIRLKDEDLIKVI